MVALRSSLELGGMAHTDFGSVSDIPGLNTAVSVSVFCKNGETGLKILDAKKMLKNGGAHILRTYR